MFSAQLLGPIKRTTVRALYASFPIYSADRQTERATETHTAQRGDPLTTRAPEVRVRELRRGEIETINSVFEALSLRSRQQRFHTGVARLTDRARRALADVDGNDHIALVAEVKPGHNWLPVGIVRLHRTSSRSAEMAIEVADAWQRCGVGRTLLVAMRDRARADGYRALCAVILPGNRRAANLLESVFPEASVTVADDEIRYVTALQPLDQALQPEPFTIDSPAAA